MTTVRRMFVFLSVCLLITACNNDVSPFIGSATPTPNGVKQLLIFNCNTDKRPVNIWVVGASAERYGTAPAQYDSYGGCGPGHGAPALQVSFNDNSTYLVIAVDEMLSGCDGDNPMNQSCQRWARPYQGDPNGRVESATV